jgi:hypothetical protein
MVLPANIEYGGIGSDLSGGVGIVADLAVGKLQWKAPVVAASTEDVDILLDLFIPGAILDGVTLVEGDRILLKDQTDASENGIYRPSDFDDSRDILGALVSVKGGITNAGKTYRNTNTSAITVGTDDITFELWPNVADVENGVYTVETQNPQTGRYLQQDGSFRDPLLVGAGTLTIGAQTTITDDTKYNAWPTVCRLRDNRILLAYTKGDTHHSDTTGKAVGKIGTEGLEGAIAWGAEFDIYDHASLWATVAAVSQISTGRIFATLWRDNPAVAGSLVGGYAYSDDEGATWSAWTDFTTTYTTEEFPVSAIVELPNGDLLVLINGRTGGSALEWDCVSLRSTDGGATFGSQTTLVLYATFTRFHTESQLVVLDNDDLFVIHRTSALSGTHYTQRSTDGGATWSAPVSAFTGYGQPNFIQASTGTLIATTRDNATADVIAYTSTDRGVTWSAGTILATSFEMEYACPIELLDDRILVVLSDQPTAATTNADVDQVYVTEGLASLATGPTGAAGGDLSGTYPNPSVVDDSHNHTSTSLPAHPAILLESGHAVPFTFDEILQESDGSDFLYASA